MAAGWAEVRTSSATYVGPHGGVWSLMKVVIGDFTKTEHWERSGFLPFNTTLPSTGGGHGDDAEADATSGSDTLPWTVLD
jgi:hypothetical protein